MRRVLRALGVAVFLLFVLFPFFWQFLTSLKTPQEIWSIPPVWIPRHGLQWTAHGPRFWANYTGIFTNHPFGRYLLNSTIVASLTTVLCLALGTVAAYSLAKLRFPGKSAVLALVLSVSMFPPVAIAPPLFLILRSLGLIDTYSGLILPYTTFALPLALWNLTTFFRQVPDELKESALVDGATPLQCLRRVFLPLVAPGMFTTAILTFIASWNEFLFALYFTTDEAHRTVPVGIALFPGQYEAPWGQIAAATVVVTVPLVIMVLLAQKRIVAGLTAGAVKG